MILASIARATTARPRQGGGRALRRSTAALVPVALALLAAPGVAAQQFDSVGSSVTVDYSVLDALGDDPNLPQMLSTGGNPAAPLASQAWPSQGGLPYAGGPYGGGPLLAPPATAPRSTLTAGQPVGSVLTAPAANQTVTLIPPSKLDAAPAPAPAKAPAPAEVPAPAPIKPSEVKEAAMPEPPPAPTPVAEPPVTTAAMTSATVTPAVVTEPAVSPGPAVSTSEVPSAPVVEASASVDADAVPVAAVETAPPSPAPSPAPSTPEAPDPEPETALFPSADDDAEDASAETGAAETEAADISSAGTAMAAEVEETSGDGQQAALPAAAMVEGQVSVTFGEGASELSAEARSKLDEVAERLRNDDTLRVQLLAYAQALDENTSRARRMSLSRALAVRSYLIEKGVRSTRMDVRALGANVEGEPADRVDIIPQVQ